MGRALLPGIARHRRDRIQVFAYTLLNQKDAGGGRRQLRSQLKSAVTRVVRLDDMSDAEAAAQINSDGMDLLVNMNGYTSSARTEIAAYRPCFLQVMLQGFAGTMGADFIHYTIVDRVQSPPELQGAYAERLAMLPVTAFLGEVCSPGLLFGVDVPHRSGFF